jgi:hypothetical protein
MIVRQTRIPGYTGSRHMVQILLFVILAPNRHALHRHCKGIVSKFTIKFCMCQNCDKMKDHNYKNQYKFCRMVTNTLDTVIITKYGKSGLNSHYSIHNHCDIHNGVILHYDVIIFPTMFEYHNV